MRKKKTNYLWQIIDKEIMEKGKKKNNFSLIFNTYQIFFSNLAQ